MTAPAPIAAPSSPVALRLLRSDHFVLGLCAVVLVVFAPFAPGFATWGNLQSVLIASLPLLLLAAGQTPVLISGGIDLSAAATVGLASVVGSLVMAGDVGWLRGHPAAVPVTLIAMLIVGATVGAFNGVCVAVLRMPAFMVTLTTLMFVGGFSVWLAQRMARTESFYQLPPAFLAFGQQAGWALSLSAAATALAHCALAHTVFGRRLYAVGHNASAARVSGIPVGATIIGAYALSGLFAAGSAILLTARLETGSPNHGKQLLLDVIGAAVIGGTSLFGGHGKVLGAVYGVLFLGLLGNALNLINLADFLIIVVKGSVILAAALLDVWRRNLRGGSL